MKSTARIISAAIFLALLLAGGFWLLRQPRPATAPVQTSAAHLVEPAAAPAAVPSAESAVSSLAVSSRAAAAAPVESASPTLKHPVLPTSGPVAPAPVEPIAPANPARQPAGEEVAATARMYAAHAPLRTPEVADPDSAANRRILGAMVSKLLIQSERAPRSEALSAPGASPHP